MIIVIIIFILLDLLCSGCAILFASDKQYELMRDAILVSIACIFITILLIYNASPEGREQINEYKFELEKVDEKTYENQKKVEDTCRMYIASYNADRITYESLINSDSKSDQAIASAAMIRANRTAATYNEYFLKNNFVWSDNIPMDIKYELPLIGVFK